MNDFAERIASLIHHDDGLDAMSKISGLSPDELKHAVANEISEGIDEGLRTAVDIFVERVAKAGSPRASTLASTRLIHRQMMTAAALAAITAAAATGDHKEALEWLPEKFGDYLRTCAETFKKAFR